MFQIEDTEIHILHGEMERLLKTVMSNFIKHDLLQKGHIHLIDFMDIYNILKTYSIYLRIFAANFISKCKLSKHETDDIIISCKHFYIKLCKQLLKQDEFDSKKNLFFYNH